MRSSYLGIGYFPIRIHPDKSVRHRHLVERAALTVQEDSVGLPDLGQELPVECQLVDATSIELKPWVKPGLPEVAVKAEHLLCLIYGSDGPDCHI